MDSRKPNALLVVSVSRVAPGCKIRCSRYFERVGSVSGYVAVLVKAEMVANTSRTTKAGVYRYTEVPVEQGARTSQYQYVGTRMTHEE